MIVSQGSEANFVPVNPADGILDLCLAVAMVLLGMTLSRRVLITRGKDPLRIWVWTDAIRRSGPLRGLRKCWGGCPAGRVPMVRPVQHGWRIW
jgi:hypothetical protein